MRWMLDYTAQQCSGIASRYRDLDHIAGGFAMIPAPPRGFAIGPFRPDAALLLCSDGLSDALQFLRHLLICR